MFGGIYFGQIPFGGELVITTVIPTTPKKKPKPLAGGSFGKRHPEQIHFVYPKYKSSNELEKEKLRKLQQQDDLMIVKLLTEFLSRQ